MVLENEVFTPDELSVNRPLLIALHGGGRDGASQIQLWKPLAAREQITVLAPNSLPPPFIEATWFTPRDGESLVAKITEVLARFPINRKEIYCFGHSLGATKALDFSFGNRNFIAAVALHSPTQAQGMYSFKADGTRRLPLGIWAGEMNCDTNWHCASTLEHAYKEHPNFLVDLRVLGNHEHNGIYTRAGLTDEIWAFLRDHKLEEPGA